MPRRARLLPLLTLAAVAIAPLAPVSAAPRQAPATDVVAGELLVKWAPAASARARAAERARFGLETARRRPVAGFELVRLDAASDPRDVAAQLRRRGAVAEAQPNFVYERQATAPVNDPLWLDLWGLSQATDVDLDVPEAWRTETGSSSVVVAVIDTGVQVAHPDLAGNVWTNPDELAGNGRDDDGNGKVDDVHGWDFHADDASVYDGTADAHGTHIAGTIAATADNGRGVAGVAPDVRVMALKFLDHEGKGSTADAIAAIAYAKAEGARVINASWGYAGSGDRALRDAIAGSGAVVVAAAGNVGSDNDTTPFIPANLDAANIVSVAAVTSVGTLASWSNHGDTTVDVGAPGERILSTVPGGYGYMSGTSMAAPHVAGVAALVLSAAPALTATDAVGVLNRAAVAAPLASLAGRTITGGMPNAAAAVAGFDSSTTTGPVATEPVAEEPAAEEPVAAEPAPAPEEPVADEPVADEPVADEPTADPVVEDEPVADGPAPYDGDGARSFDRACPTLVSAGWTDVPVGSTHADGIDCATMWQVFVGSSGGAFAPQTRLSRGQLASVLTRAIEQATGAELPAGSDRFSDDDGSAHETSINRLAALGVVGGVSATSYAPSAPVSRGQFATMLAGTYVHLVGAIPAGEDAFTDDDGNTHASAIDGLAGLGVVTGVGGTSYAPGDILTRAQSATMIARLIDALVEADVTA